MHRDGIFAVVGVIGFSDADGDETNLIVKLTRHEIRDSNLKRYSKRKPASRAGNHLIQQRTA
jgi:hypothetical protein